MNALTSPRDACGHRSSQRDLTIPGSALIPLSSDSLHQLLRIPSCDNLSDSSPIMNQRLKIYDNQVGGHKEFVKPCDSCLLLKPYDHSEFSFYNELLSEKFKALLPFTARCYGEVDVEGVESSESSQAATPVSSEETTSKYVMLEDLAHGLEKPCILDIKMGLIQRSLQNYSEEKLKRAKNKSMATTSHSLGMRICGVVYYLPNTNERVFHDKYVGRQLDIAGAYRTIYSFFQSIVSFDERKSLIDRFIEKLVNLKSVIMDLVGFRFWSGSLLLVYDAASPGTATLKMIDFAQSTILQDEPGTPDYELIHGIESLLMMLQNAKSDKGEPLDLQRVEGAPDASIQTSELLKISSL